MSYSSSSIETNILSDGNIKYFDKSLTYVCENKIITIVNFHEDGWDSSLDDIDITYKLNDIIKKYDLYFTAMSI
jgi:hypothetical protein